MKSKLIVSLLAVMGVVCFLIGCEGGDDDSSGGSTGDSAVYAGTWTGRVCGRDLTMTINQSGTTLSGSYTLSGPTFTENMSGTVSTLTPPATATLNAGGDRRFELTFSSANALSGGYFKGTTQVCTVSATK